MKHITTKITLDELKSMAENSFGDMVKAVVDVENKTMIVDAELHADQEKSMIEKGLKQATKFSWDETERKTCHVFEELVKLVRVGAKIDKVQLELLQARAGFFSCLCL